MNPFDYEKSDISSDIGRHYNNALSSFGEKVVLNQDYFKSFEDNEDHLLLDMDSLVPRKDDELMSRIYESSMKKSFLGGDNDSDSHSATINNNNSNNNHQDGEEVLHWPTKPIEEWDSLETSKWLTAAASYIGQSYSSIQQSLLVTGRELLTLTRQEFLNRDPIFGDRLHSLLHTQHLAAKGANLDGYFHGGGGGGQEQHGRQQEQKRDHGGERTAAETFQKLSIEDEQQNNGSNNASDAESDNSVEISTKRQPGRPRLTKTKKNPTSQGKLWEFIRDLLRNRNTCPSLICWEDYSQAKFRFVRSDEVAKLWGSRKGNTKMTYEKLSRAMRYYYKRKIFLPVLGRRLVYQFGPNATGWQTDNPNFRLY